MTIQQFFESNIIIYGKIVTVYLCTKKTHQKKKNEIDDCYYPCGDITRIEAIFSHGFALQMKIKRVQLYDPGWEERGATQSD